MLAALALPEWVALRGEHLWIVAAIGVAGAFGQYAITEAFRAGEASQIAPLEYTALVWGVGLYLLRRERVHAETEHP